MDLSNFTDGFIFLAWVSGLSSFMFVIGTFAVFSNDSDNKWLMFAAAAVSVVIFLSSGFLAVSL